MTSSARQQVKDRIRHVRDGGSTALYDGWLHGVHEVAAHQLDRGVNRCLLLTDGLANVGECRHEALVSAATELAQRGVATSTFGVGANYNHYLLEGMARGGRGSYYFIENPRQIPDVFRRELGELGTVVGRRGELEIRLNGDGRICVISDVGQAETGRAATIPLHDIYSADERRFYLDVTTPPDLLHAPTVTASLRCEDAEGRRVVHTESLAFVAASDPEADRAPRDSALQRRATRIRAAHAADQAMREAAAGRQRVGAQVLQDFATAYAPMMDPADRRHFEEACEELEEQRYSEMKQKSMHSLAYERRMSRGG